MSEKLLRVMSLFFVIIIILTSIGIAELILRINNGDPGQALLKSDEAYSNFEIYAPFFRKVYNRDTRRHVYMTQRSKASQIIFPVEKKKTTKRIFIIGESVASVFSRSKETLVEYLKQAAPGYDFEVIDCATAGYDSFRISLVAKEIIDYSPDVIILFAGNNEFYPRINLDPWLTNPLTRHLYERLWVFRSLYNLFHRNEKFEDNSLASQNAKFKKNIHAILSFCQNKDIPLILFTLPVNYRDFPPFAYQFNVIYNREFFEARLQIENGQPEKAVVLLSNMLLRGFENNPYVHFYFAKSLEAIGDYPAAKKHYLEALEYDTYPGYRCPPSRNKILMGLAEEKGVIIVDLALIFSNYAPHGLLGDMLFEDHCHWYKACNEAVITETIKKISDYNRVHAANLLGIGESLPRSFLSFDSTLFLQRGQKEILDRKQTLWLWGIARALDDCDKFVDPSVYSFMRVYAIDPGLLLTTMESLDKITELFMKNIWAQRFTKKIYSDWYAVVWHIAEAYRQLGKTNEALEGFTSSIGLKPTQVFPYLFRGLTYCEKKDFKMARKDWEIVHSRDVRFEWLLDLLERIESSNVALSGSHNK